MKEPGLRPDLIDGGFDSTAQENGKVIFEGHAILAFVDRHLLNIGKSLLQILQIGLTQVEDHFAGAVSRAP